MTAAPADEQPTEQVTEPSPEPSVEDLARAWHALADHTRLGVAFGQPGCDCLHVAPRLAQIRAWFDPRTAITEPEGLGAVVANPVTETVWLRAAHPRLPWKGPDAPPQEWCDPTGEDWFEWADLPRPLLPLATGWIPDTAWTTTATPPAKPPEPGAPPAALPAEPTGLAALVSDASGTVWIRMPRQGWGWIQVYPVTESEYVTDWDDLTPPVTIHRQGWVSP